MSKWSGQTHLIEPLLGILLDQQPRPTHLALRSILQNLYKQMMEPIPDLKFSSVERHTLPALEDGFGRKYKQECKMSFTNILSSIMSINWKVQWKSWWNSLLQLCQSNEEFSIFPVDNKVWKNYFGHLSKRQRSKGCSAFQAISNRLVLKTSSDLAFGNEGANMLKDKELKAKQKEVHQTEADFSKSQREIMKHSGSDKLARDTGCFMPN